MGTRRSQHGRVRAPTRPPPTRHRGPAKSPPQSARIIDYQSLFEQAPDAILVVDSEGHYIDANPAACVLTGYARDELLQMRVGDLTTPSERPRSAERFDLLQKTGRTRADRILQRKNGTQVQVEAHAIELGNGTYQTIIRDITERVDAQQELQRALDAYSTLVGLCNAAVIAADYGGRITSWNPAAEALFGYSAKEADGMPVTELIPRRLRRKHLSSFRRHADSATEELFGRTLHAEALRKDGTEVPVEIAVAVGRQADRLVYTAVVRNFAEHRDMIEKLNDALQRLQFHVERMPLAYIVWDTDFRVVEWNPAAERTFGYAKSEAVGRHAYDLIVPPDAVSAVDAVWFDLLKGDTSSHSINANVRKDGSRLTCEWFNTPLRDSAGRVRGVASMTMDVSKREAMEAQIRNAQKLEGLGVMASGIAHDFNSSLMIILGNTALLRSVKGLPAGAIEHIELIEEAGSRADALIKRLLAYSRTGRHNPQPTDLNTVIQDAIKFVRSSIGKRYDLKLRLADGLATILADRSQVEQILLNLCFNAKEAMAHGGAVAITTRCADLTAADAVRCVPPDSRPGRYVVMAVTDIGCGMDEGTVMRVFDPFFTTKVEGHGLGLAAVLGILRQHSAMAMIDSKPGAGTEVQVFFPVHREETKPKRRRPAGKRRS